MLSPMVGGGEGGGGGRRSTHEKLSERALPGVGILTFTPAPGPQGREFDMVAILEDREKLEMIDLPFS